jgi:uncharacterized OsmC-like protein
MSNEITVTYDGVGDVNVELPHSSTLAIGVPEGCGGAGQGPSPKDLFVIGYASCRIVVMDMAAREAGFDINGTKITVSPTWTEDNESALEKINSTVILPRQLTDEQLDILRQSERYCPVHNSLRRHVQSTLTFEIESRNVC